MTIILLNNRYQVIQILGVGGFSETFLAEDTHMPSRRRCVIKQLKPISNDTQTYQLIQKRFEREASALEYLGESSDQIPKLYAYFVENGQFYLIQEWIQGQTLTEIVATQGCQSESTVQGILLSLLSVLDYVHSKGMIHRDIKPDNIIISAVDSKPVLIDFGAVKETIRTIATTPGHLTQSLVIGTPGYMPSEQAIGRPVYATDIFSLGLTAIYLLTGKKPSELPTNQQTGEIMWQNYAPQVSPQFAMVLNQAIKPHASDRYSTASKMLYALNSATSHTSPTVSFTPVVTAHTQHIHQPLSTPPTISYRKPRKPVWLFGGLIAGSLIAGLAIFRLISPEKSEIPIVTNSNPASSPIPSLEPDNQPTASLPSATPSIQPQQPQIPVPLSGNNDQPSADESPARTNQEPIISDSSTPTATLNPQTATDNQPAVIPQTQAPATQQDKPDQKKKESINKPSVPAFPTGTARSTVEATLGRKSRDLKGLWGNTRAVTYKLVPNQVDLGYLFDRKSGRLVQTEAAFAQSVDPQVMQNTLSGMLNGQATSKIQQGLQQIQQRQRDDFSFTLGSVNGQIVRQNCDLIYISIWEADLHPIGNPSAAKRC